MSDPVVARAAERGAASHDDVVRARSGDRAAFERLYRSRVGPVSRYVAAMIRDATRAEDVTAQTFMLAWRDIAKLREVERFDAWLFRIAHNQAMNEISRRRPTTSIDDAPEIADERRFGAPESELAYAGEVERLRHAMTRLPEAQRQVLLLRYFRELPSREVAVQLDKSEQSVWALTYRALRSLKRILEEER